MLQIKQFRHLESKIVAIVSLILLSMVCTVAAAQAQGSSMNPQEQRGTNIPAGYRNFLDTGLGMRAAGMRQARFQVPGAPPGGGQMQNQQEQTKDTDLAEIAKNAPGDGMYSLKDLYQGQMGIKLKDIKLKKVPLPMIATMQNAWAECTGERCTGPAFQKAVLIAMPLYGALNNSPESQMHAAQATGQAQAEQAGDAGADVAREQSASAIGFCSAYVENFTTNPIWNMVRDQIFVPMAVLLLLPGAVLAQMRAIVAAGSPVLGEVNPFEGILRSIVAVFLIPATALVVNYGIDLNNSIAFTINSEYFRIFGSDMYRDALCAEIRATPTRQAQSNRNALDQPTYQGTPLLGGSTPFAQFEGRMMENSIQDPCAGIDQAPADRSNEAMSSGVAATRMMMNGSNASLAAAWNILCAFQLAYLYYLWCVGPIMAALWVYPLRTLRNALPSWTEGVITLCFWSLFWNTVILLMACFKGVDETGTMIMTALNFLATASVKYAFDFAGLVKAAGQEAAGMAAGAAQHAAQQGGGGGGAASRGGGASRSGGAAHARATGAHVGGRGEHLADGRRTGHLGGRGDGSQGQVAHLGGTAGDGLPHTGFSNAGYGGTIEGQLVQLASYTPGGFTPAGLPVSPSVPHPPLEAGEIHGGQPVGFVEGSALGQTFDHDRLGNMLDMNGNPYQVDASGNPIDANGLPYAQDQFGNPVDGNGNVVDANGVSYDAGGNVVDANGDVISYANGDVVTTDAAGDQFTYNAQGDLISAVDAAGNVIDGPRTDVDSNTAYSYDVAGNLVVNNGSNNGGLTAAERLSTAPIALGQLGEIAPGFLLNGGNNRGDEAGRRNLAELFSNPENRSGNSNAFLGVLQGQGLGQLLNRDFGVGLPPGALLRNESGSIFGSTTNASGILLTSSPDGPIGSFGSLGPDLMRTSFTGGDTNSLLSFNGFFSNPSQNDTFGSGGFSPLLLSEDGTLNGGTGITGLNGMPLAFDNISGTTITGSSDFNNFNSAQSVFAFGPDQSSIISGLPNGLTSPNGLITPDGNFVTYVPPGFTNDVSLINNNGSALFNNNDLSLINNAGSLTFNAGSTSSSGDNYSAISQNAPVSNLLGGTQVTDMTMSPVGGGSGVSIFSNESPAGPIGPIANPSVYGGTTEGMTVVNNPGTVNAGGTLDAGPIVSQGGAGWGTGGTPTVDVTSVGGGWGAGGTPTVDISGGGWGTAGTQTVDISGSGWGTGGTPTVDVTSVGGGGSPTTGANPTFEVATGGTSVTMPSQGMEVVFGNDTSGTVTTTPTFNGAGAPVVQSFDSGTTGYQVNSYPSTTGDIISAFNQTTNGGFTQNLDGNTFFNASPGTTQAGNSWVNVSTGPDFTQTATYGAPSYTVEGGNGQGGGFVTASNTVPGEQSIQMPGSIQGGGFVTASNTVPGEQSIQMPGSMQGGGFVTASNTVPGEQSIQMPGSMQGGGFVTTSNVVPGDGPSTSLMQPGNLVMASNTVQGDSFTTYHSPAPPSVVPTDTVTQASNSLYSTYTAGGAVGGTADWTAQSAPPTTFGAPTYAYTNNGAPQGPSPEMLFLPATAPSAAPNVVPGYPVADNNTFVAPAYAGGSGTTTTYGAADAWFTPGPAPATPTVVASNDVPTPVPLNESHRSNVQVTGESDLGLGFVPLIPNSSPTNTVAQATPPNAPVPSTRISYEPPRPISVNPVAVNPSRTQNRLMAAMNRGNNLAPNQGGVPRTVVASNTGNNGSVPGRTGSGAPEELARYQPGSDGDGPPPVLDAMPGSSLQDAVMLANQRGGRIAKTDAEHEAYMKARLDEMTGIGGMPDGGGTSSV